MPFKERSAMSQKLEFVTLAGAEDANVSELCRRFGIGRTSAYKLLKRYKAEGMAGLEEGSRRPHHCPRQCAAKTEAAVLAVRKSHPAWGGRKIAKKLEGRHAVAPSTVTGILRRNGVELGRFGGGAIAYTRFEHEAPNDFWQMDFKGHVAMMKGRLYPLTVLDDHSRYAILIGACDNERGETVKELLAEALRRHGLPRRIGMDNGSPWGNHGPYTAFDVWLIERGIGVTHSRPRHPQTLGKDERFHRSLKAEAMSGPPFRDLEDARHALERWRGIYNHERPHEALGLETPITRYRPSPRPYRETPEPFEYPTTDLLRKVQQEGIATLKSREFRLPKAFAGKTIALRPTARDGVFEAFFRHQHIATIDFTTPNQKA
jgi:transposase InsO family protein